MKLKGRVAIVTGGASGIGKAVVKKFAEAGAAGVIIADVDARTAERVAGMFSSKHRGKVLAIQTDVSNPNSIGEMVKSVANKFGRIDILINNAGICPVVPWDQTTLEDWNRVIEINLTGAFLCTKAVIPVMRRQKYGRIVYVSSAGAFLGSLVAHVAYGASKAGMITLMKSVAKEFGAEGISANAVAPGTIDTPLTDSFGEEIKRRFTKAAPLKRQGTPAEVADAVLFLVSNYANYVNGATLHVNGGSLLV